MLSKLPPFTKNFFFITMVIFLFWMLFIDSNDFYSQYQLRKKLNTLENEKEYYTEKIQEVKDDREQLFSDMDKLEKYAREKYLMKKETEDVYIIVEEE